MAKDLVIIFILIIMGCGVSRSARVREGYNLYRNSQYSQAAQCLRDHLEDHPDDAEAHFLLGQSYEELNNWDLALSEYRKTVDLEPRHLNARRRLGLGYLETGSNLFAAREFMTVLQYQPDDPLSLFKLGVIFHREGKYNQAIKYFQRVIAVDPQYSKAYYNLGVIYAYDQKDLQQAIYYFRRFAELNPDSEHTAEIKQWLEENREREDSRGQGVKDSRENKHLNP
ncbi:MAG: tetratricopeptide repeat protein [Deltaproteobacteria bacterium]|nr:MAG: tetratricopeptide repeat protein [Deltaproteobacteria bacterium]